MENYSPIGSRVLLLSKAKPEWFLMLIGTILHKVQPMMDYITILIHQMANNVKLNLKVDEGCICGYMHK